MKRLSLSINGKMKEFDYIFLRDACHCHQCVDPTTQQKAFKTSDIPSTITSKEVLLMDDQTLKIKWSNDIKGYDATHTTLHSFDFLLAYSDIKNIIRSRFNAQHPVLWDTSIMESNNLQMDFDDYMQSESILHKLMKHLRDYGLVFLKNVPESRNSVENIGLRIGTLKDTFYGRSWNVHNLPNAKNVAYTNKSLGLHMDLLYMANPPGFQFLHCLRNSSFGGESIFADSFRAINHIRMASKLMYNSLLKFPVAYQYKNDGHHYHFTHPTVELEKHSALEIHQVANVNWSPPFQAPLESDTSSASYVADLRIYLEAAKEFSTSVESKSNLFELMLHPGDCVIFNNRRVLHGRRSFSSNSGERLLRGAYIDTDVFLSKFRVLSAKYGI
ncbi:MAG: hypothetical protein M1829_001294 [Trizodia sp. TS-e1964]|nr:MAG: hypothetical protein M1829_001294 [Trizodia sp. TS-e1964]